MLAMAIPRNVNAEDFSYSYQGKTLYYDYITNAAGNEVKVVGYDNDIYPMTGTLTIPTTVMHNSTTYTVTAIGYHAFEYCDGLTSISIPNLVTVIDTFAFAFCHNIVSVMLGISVDSIKWGAFANCTSLRSIEFPSSVTYIDGAFGGSGLTSVTLDGNIAYIGERTFWQCDSLTTVTIGRAVTSIGEDAFAECSNLTSVVYNADSCYFHGDVSCPPFYWCLSINNIVIGDSVRVIPNNLFSESWVQSPITITIPSSVTYIGANAFYFENYTGNYTGNIAFTMLSEEPPIVNGSFNDELLVVFNIPCGAYDSYYNGTGWYDYRNCLREPDAGISLTLLSDNESMGSAGVILQHGDSIRCDSTAIVVATAIYGYHFDHWNNGSTANPDTLHLTGDCTLTAFFAPNIYTITVEVDNPEMGSATVNGNASATVPYGENVTLTATAYVGYHFDYWSDYNTDNPRTMTITSDSIIRAYFVVDGTDGIGNVSTDDVIVYVQDGHIVVEGAEDREVRIYDMLGCTVDNHALPAGIYMVRVGDLPIRKVAVLRN